MTELERRFKIEELKMNEFQYSKESDKKRFQKIRLALIAGSCLFFIMELLTGATTKTALWLVVAAELGYGVFTLNELIESTEKITEYKEKIDEINVELADCEYKEKTKIIRY